MLVGREEEPFIIAFLWVNAGMHMACTRLGWLHLALVEATKMAHMVALGRRAKGKQSA
jgi:hypothetical protein